MTGGITLRPHQTGGIDQLRAHLRQGMRRLVLEIPTGGGKSLRKGTPVMMADGAVKPIEDVRVGEQLMGPDGGVRNVLSLGRGQETMYEVRPTKGDPYYVNASHILSLRKTPGSDGLRLADGSLIPKHADVVNINVELLERSNATVRHCLKGWRSDAIEFHRDRGPLLVDPYILGAWLGDGHSAGPTLCKPHGKMVEAWAAYGASLGLRTYEYKKNEKDCSAWRLAWPDESRSIPNPVRQALQALGVIGNKHIPDAYKFASVADRLQMIAGLLDSDGHATHSGYDWISKCRQMAEDFVFVCRSVGLAAYVTPCAKGIKSAGFAGTYYRVYVSGDCDRIPCRDKPVASRRQKKRHLVHGLTLTRLGVEDYYGVVLDGDHLFLLGDFTVTHNTECAIAMIHAAIEKGGRVVFAVNRTQLLDQTVRRFEAAGLSPGVIQSANTRNTHRRVLVASIQTLCRRWEEMPTDITLLVIDEAHAAGGDTRYHELISKVHASRARTAVIGLTATPWARGMAKHYEALQGPLFQAKVTPTSAQALIDAGFLVDADIYAPGSPDMEGVKVVAGEWHEGQTAERMNTPKLVGDIVTHWLKLAGGKKTVVFASNIAHSEHIAQQFQRAGIDARHLDHRVKQEEKTALLAAFDASEFTVLCNPLLLREGWDCPSVEVLVLARPTRSLISYVQIVGRILRTHDNISVLYRSYMEARDVCRGDEMGVGRQAGEHGGRCHGVAIGHSETLGVPAMEREEPRLLTEEGAHLPAAQWEREGAEAARELHDGLNSWQGLQRSQAGSDRMGAKPGESASGQSQGREQAEQRGRKSGVDDEPRKHESCATAWLIPGKSARGLARDEQAAGVAGAGDQAGAEIVSSWSIDGTGKKIRCTQDDDKRNQGWQVLGACFVANDAADAKHLAMALCRMHKGEESLLVVEACTDTGAANRIAGVAIKKTAIVLDHSGTSQNLGFPTDDRSDEPLCDGKPKAGSDAEKKEKVEALPKPCTNCHLLKPALTRKCPACGHEAIRPCDIEVEEGSLVLKKKSAKHEAIDHTMRFGTKQQTYSMLWCIADERGYKSGWVSRKYKEIFGVWPKNMIDRSSIASPEIRSWVKAEAIRWANAKKKEDARAYAG